MKLRHIIKNDLTEDFDEYEGLDDTDTFPAPTAEQDAYNRINDMRDQNRGSKLSPEALDRELTKYPELDAIPEMHNDPPILFVSDIHNGDKLIYCEPHEFDNLETLADRLFHDKQYDGQELIDLSTWLTEYDLEVYGEDEPKIIRFGDIKIRQIREDFDEYEGLDDTDKFGEEDDDPVWVNRLNEIATSLIVFATPCPKSIKISTRPGMFTSQVGSTDMLILACNREDGGVIPSEEIEDLEEIHKIIGNEHSDPPELISSWLNRVDVSTYDDDGPQIMLYYSTKNGHPGPRLEEVIL